MTQFNNLFVVYDPTREEQPALDRAAAIAEERAASLHVFACIFSDTSKSADKPAEVKRLIAEQQKSLNEVVAPLVAEGIKVTTEVEWDKDWYQAVVRASTKRNADMVLKSSYKHSSSKRLLNRTSDWTIMRECLCPVLLVKGRKPRDVPRVLAAIDICAKRASYERLNERVISVAKEILDRQRMDVHVVNAFSDFKGVPDRQELIRICGVESNKIHIKVGDPDKVIVAQAKKLDVSLVVVGNSARSGLSAALHGNTVEKMLDKLRCDVLSMP
ncbi:MAG: universal stress protein [Proteobacteria bacterium]|nr:universal stress protein [Pseudomonadota bacterium]